MTISPFHLAFPVHDLAAARDFYGSLLGCPEGRSSDEWVDFDFLPLPHWFDALVRLILIFWFD